MPALPYCQNPEQLLEYTNNTPNFLDKCLDNNKENIRQSNRNKQRPATLSNFTLQNRLLNKSSPTFSESEFLASTLISDTWYKHFETQNKNLFHPFND